MRQWDNEVMSASLLATSLLVTPIVTLVGHFGKCPIEACHTPSPKVGGGLGWGLERANL
jgi:hypothetical protein